MYNGKVVVSTNVGGISDFVNNRVNGYYFDSFNAEPYVAIINDILAKKIDTISIGAKATETAINSFNLQRLIHDIKKIYEQN